MVLQEFSTAQQTAFCVYSGKGVSQLRAFLTELFDHITEMNGTTDDTEYEDDDDDPEAYQEDETPEPESDLVGDLAEDLNTRRVFTHNVSQQRSTYITPLPISTPISREVNIRQLAPESQPTIMAPPPGTMPRITAHASTSNSNAVIPAAALRRPRAVGASGSYRSLADILPIVENSRSPPPSDVASNLSAGTNRSNGATFFRTYQDPNSRRNSGALTPDLNYAEIGHGRGAQPNPFNLRRGHEQIPRARSPPTAGDQHTPASIAMENTANASSGSETVVWPYREPASPAQGSPSTVNIADNQGRGRSVKRSLRNTFNAAEQYASSFLFGRHHDEGPGPSGSGGNMTR
jgi:F-box and leucine-rich repeat protein GRR1